MNFDNDIDIVLKSKKYLAYNKYPSEKNVPAFVFNKDSYITGDEYMRLIQDNLLRYIDKHPVDPQSTSKIYAIMFQKRYDDYNKNYVVRFESNPNNPVYYFDKDSCLTDIGDMLNKFKTDGSKDLQKFINDTYNDTVKKIKDKIKYFGNLNIAIFLTGELIVLFFVIGILLFLIAFAFWLICVITNIILLNKMKQRGHKIGWQEWFVSATVSPYGLYRNAKQYRNSA